MDFNFKKFEQIHQRFENRMSLTKSNSIGLPTGFYNSNNIKDLKFISLFWDQERLAIGIQFHNNEAEKSRFKIIHNKSGLGASVVVRSFFTVNQIDPKKYYGKYSWQKINQEGIGELYVMELKERRNEQK